MEITYLGHASFKIKGKTSKLIIDPYDPDKLGFKFPKQKADIVLISHHHFDHDYIDGVGDYSLVIDAPGEYEKDGTLIFGYGTFHDDKNGTERGKNTIYEIHIDDFTILHLGDLGHELNEETLEKLPDVDILMIPVGGNYTINSQKAVKIISSIEPGIVIPMHYKTPQLDASIELEPVDKFLDEMGIKANGSKDILVINNRIDIPTETEVQVLKPANQ